MKNWLKIFFVILVCLSGVTAFTGEIMYKNQKDISSMKSADHFFEKDIRVSKNGKKEDYKIISEFKNKYGGNWNIVWDQKKSIPKRVFGSNIDLYKGDKKFYETKEQRAKSVIEGFISENREFFKVNLSDLKLEKFDYDSPLYESQEEGMYHVSYQQTYHGIPIYGSYIGVTAINGKIVLIKENVYPDIDLDINQKIMKDKAIDIALKEMSVTSSDPISISLVVYPKETTGGYEYHLAWKTEFPLLKEPFGAWEYFIDASNGDILYKYDKVVFADINGTVTGMIIPEYPSQSQVVKGFWNETLVRNSSNSIFYSGMGNSLSNSINTSSSINLTGASSANLTFDTKYFIETNWDYVYVFISNGTDFDMITNYTGSQTDWTTENINITSYVGQQIWINFSYVTDPSVANEGFYVDNITVVTDVGTVFSDTADSFANWTNVGFSKAQDNISFGETGIDGYYNFSGLPSNFILRSELKGPFVYVHNYNQTDAFHEVTITTPSTHSWNWSDDDTSYYNEESNVFYHVNVVHDFFTNGSPFNISSMNYQAIATVDFFNPFICPGNAFSDGTDLYFCVGGGGYNATSLLSDVIYHEYTHSVVNHVYTVDLPYSGESGAMNEGWADYFAATINNDSCMGEEFYTGSSACLRDLNNTYRYPDDWVGEVHYDSRIISGAMWDLRQMVGASVADARVISAMKLESFNFTEFLDDTIIVDDDNANLNDGTPNLLEICTAFAVNHGINPSYSSYCDITPPSITIHSPKNITYNSSQIQLNVSADENISTWIYNLNSAGNQTFPPNTTITAPEGPNNLTVYANDTSSLGNWNSTTVYFTVNLPVHNDTGYNFSTIQEAIDNSTTDSNITVDAVTLTENVDVNKPINLIGAGAGLTIVQAANSSVHVFNVTANWVNISGFTVTGASGSGKAGIYLNANYSSISNNTIKENDQGIYLYNSTNNTISNNTIGSNSNSGIWIRTSSDHLIKGNVISNNSIGLELSTNSTVNIITDNEFRDNNQNGISVIQSSNNNTIYHNNFINNTINANDTGTNNTWDSGSYSSGGNYWSNWTSPDKNKDGIVDQAYNITGGSSRDRYPVTSENGWLNIDPSLVVDASSPACLSGESLHITIQSAVDANTGTSMIYVCEGGYTENVDVDRSIELIGAGMDVVTVNASNSGDHVFNVTANWVNISGFTVTGANGSGKAGIYLNANYSNISNNTIKENDQGIYLHNSTNNTISNNTVGSNSNSGIWIRTSSDHLVKGNVISNNSIGLELSTNSTANVITDNEFRDNNQGGISVIQSSSNNTITNNTASNNNYGISLNSSSNNNALTNNTLTGNIWDFYSEDSSNNTITTNHFTNITASFTYSGDIKVNTSSSPGGEPQNLLNISKYLNITNTSSAWLYLNISYADADLGAINESTLKMYRHNGTAWENVSGTNGVDTSNNYVHANLTSFSVFAPMGKDTNPPDITITSPESKTYSKNTVNLNFTTQDPSGINWTGYRLDDGNITTTTNTTLTGLSNSQHNVTVYANDTYGNMDSSTVLFTVSVSAPQQQSSSGGGGGGGGGQACIEEGFQEMSVDMMNCIIKKLNLRYKKFYDVPVTTAATYIQNSDKTFDYPAPTYTSVRETLSKGVTTIGGDNIDIYSLTAENTLNKLSYTDSILVARGDLEADSIAAVAYAKASNMPILLTKPDELPEITRDIIEKLGPKRVTIVGGPVAVSKDVEAELKGISTVKTVNRIAGADRSETAAEIAKSIKAPDTIVIADGYGKKLEAVFIANAYKAPIVYVTGDEVPEVTKDYLKANRFNTNYRPMKVVFVKISDKAKDEIENIMYPTTTNT